MKQTHALSIEQFYYKSNRTAQSRARERARVEMKKASKLMETLAIQVNEYVCDKTIDADFFTALTLFIAEAQVQHKHQTSARVQTEYFDDFYDCVHSVEEDIAEITALKELRENEKILEMLRAECVK
jgi:hypothetical protein